MRLKKPFSILELMTVVLVILLMLSLLMPVFQNLKMNARSALCISQLRQVGVLINSYVATYNGKLPNDGGYSYSDPAYRGGARHVGDIPKPSTGNVALYEFWNGHLLPFMSTGLKSYHCNTKVAIDGRVRWSDGTVSAVDKAPANPFNSGWVVINEAFVNGGYGDLKTFICPEVHNTYDMGALKKTGAFVPRIHFATYAGAGQFNYNYMNTSVPTSYLANTSYFGYNQGYRPDVDSMRIDEIGGISQKVLLIEGGLASPSYREDNGNPYFFAGDSGNIVGRSLAIDNYQIGFRKSSTDKHRYNFVHDNMTECWSTFGDATDSSRLDYYFDGNHCSSEVAKAFNVAFSGKAYLLPMSAVGTHRGYHVVSFILPINPNGSLNEVGMLYDNFLKKNGVTKRYTKYEYYDAEYQYLTGNMNVLFGDGSVALKDHGWLLNNRYKIASSNTAE